MKVILFTDNQNKEGMSISSILAGIILGLIACALITLCSSCTTTKYVPVIEHHTDTLIQTKVQKDSVFMHDSVEVRIAGDTVTIDRWHTKYISKEVHDTIYQTKVVTKEVFRKSTVVAKNETATIENMNNNNNNNNEQSQSESVGCSMMCDNISYDLIASKN